MKSIQSIEPFPRYPESVIDSKDKAVKVIRQNYYYFVVMGLFYSIIGSVVLMGEAQNREILISGITNISYGIMYIGLASLAKILKIRLAAFFLLMFLILNFVGDFILIGTDIIDFYFLFKVILVGAAYRMTKALTYYNQKIL